MDREEILSKILRWSEQAGLKMTRIEDPSADFHIVVSEPNLPPIDILHPQVDSEFVLFASRVVPPEDMQKKILDLDTQQRGELVSKIKLQLLSTNLEYRVVGAAETPSAYEIYSKFFLAGTNIQNFWQTYVNMKNAFITIMLLHQKSVGLI